MIEHRIENGTPPIAAFPEITEAEALLHEVRHLLVRSEEALISGDACGHVETLERWIESYRRGLSAAQKISVNGREILQKTRAQLHLSLDELLRLEDEGGNPASREQAEKCEELRRAIKRIDRLVPVVEQSFQTASVPEHELA